MKINLTKLGKIQGEFRLGNIGNFTALEIKNLLKELISNYPYNSKWKIKLKKIVDTNYKIVYNKLY